MCTKSVSSARWLLLSLLLLFCGCDEAEIQGGGQTGTATVRLQTRRVQGLSGASLRFTGYDFLGQVIFGPRQEPWSQEVELQLPTTLHSLTVERIEEASTVGIAHFPVALQAGQILTLSDLVLQRPEDLVESLAIEPPDLTLARGTSGQLKAVAVLKEGSALDLSHSVSWTSPGTPVSAGGVVSATAPGSAPIQAQLGGLQASCQVNVSDATLVSQHEEQGEDGALRVAALFSDGSQQELPSAGEVRAQTTSSLTRINVTPTSINFPKGVTVAYKATGVYANGTSKDITSLVTCRAHPDRRHAQQRQLSQRNNPTVHRHRGLLER